MPLAAFRRRVGRLAGIITAGEPAPGAEKARAPGQRAAEAEARAGREGILLAGGTAHALNELAVRLGLDPLPG